MKNHTSPSLPPIYIMLIGLAVAIVLYYLTPMEFPLSLLTGLAISFLGAIVWRTIRAKTNPPA